MLLVAETEPLAEAGAVDVTEEVRESLAVADTLLLAKMEQLAEAEDKGARAYSFLSFDPT